MSSRTLYCSRHVVALVCCSMTFSVIIVGSAESNCHLSHLFQAACARTSEPKNFRKKDVGLHLEMAVMEQHGNYVFTSYR